MNGTKRKTGTREWSKYSINICKGCSNGCLYCYARQNALRFGRITDGQAWENEDILDEPVGNGKHGARQKLDGRIMFPTSHDITENNLEECCELARSMIRAGNEVLIVSKPAPERMAALLGELLQERADARELVTLRYTITSLLDYKTSQFWEPNAPLPEERRQALREAFEQGWTTSVSMEPLLDARNVDVMVQRLDPFVTDTIWVGNCRDLKQRTAWTLTGDEPGLALLQEDQAEATMLGVYERLKNNPKIRWKDSYTKVLQLIVGGTWVDGLREIEA